MMNKYKLTIAFDGKNYCGWQVQANGISIQKTLQNAIEIYLRHPIQLTGSSRTDAGVHALGFKAHFSTEKELLSSPRSKRAFLDSVNGLLPHEIRLLDIEAVDEHFHARYKAIRKTYRYHISLAPILLPFKREYTYHIRRPLDIEAMQLGCKELIGTHNFTSFANQPNKGSCARNPIRTLFRLDLLQENDEITFHLEGDGFLYKMVRNIVGTLLDIGAKKLSFHDLPKILAAKDRKASGSTAPAHGLFLVKVEYPQSNNESSVTSSNDG